MLDGARRGRRLDGARLRDAGPRRRRAGRFERRSPADLRDRLFRAIVDDGALRQQRGDRGGRRVAGSRCRARDTIAEAAGDGTWRLTGEKTWTTWLPNLTHAFVTARVAARIPIEVGVWLVDLAAAGVNAAPGSRHGHAWVRIRPARARRRRGPGDALLVRRHAARSGSARPGARGMVRDRDRGDLPRGGGGCPEGCRSLGARSPARRRLDIGRRHAVGPAQARAAGRRAAGGADRRPRRRPALGRSGGRGDAAGLAAAAADVALAKLVATRAAVNATDEALRIAGGPGFLAGRLERAFRDARAGLINPPLEDVATAGFGRSVLDRERP